MLALTTRIMRFKTMFRLRNRGLWRQHVMIFFFICFYFPTANSYSLIRKSTREGGGRMAVVNSWTVHGHRYYFDDSDTGFRSGQRAWKKFSRDIVAAPRRNTKRNNGNRYGMTGIIIHSFVYIRSRLKCVRHCQDGGCGVVYIFGRSPLQWLSPNL